MNFFLDLSDSNKRAFGFVSTNIFSFSLHRVNRLSAAIIKRPFIFYFKNDIIELVGKQVSKIQHYFGDKLINVTIYIRVD